MSSSRDARHKCEGVKALHVHRDAIKERLRQRHQRREAQARHARMMALRAGNDADNTATTDGYSAYDVTTAAALLPQQRPHVMLSPPHYGDACGGESLTCSPSCVNAATPSPSHAMARACSAGDAMPAAMPTDESWRDLGDEFGCDVDKPDVMEYLLALEEEIRQERLVALYEEANDAGAWADYYDSLTR